MTATVTPLPRIELDADGRAFRAFVPSATRPGVTYELRHYPSGWCHEDVECRGWVERGDCYHRKAMEDVMNELAEETRAITVQTSPLALMNDVDLSMIMSNKLTPVKEWTYRFAVRGQQVEGISARGVQDASRALSSQGEAIRCTDVILVKEDEHEAYFKAVAGRFAITPDGKEILTDVTVRAKRQPKYIRLKEGEMKFNEFWYEIGTTKAARNAVDALIPEALRQYMKVQARIAASDALNGAPPPQRREQARPAATQAPRQDEPPMPEEPAELRGRPAAGVAPPPPPAPPAPPAERPKPAKVRLARFLRDARGTRSDFAELCAGINASYPGALNEKGDLMISGEGALTDEEAQRIIDGLAPEPAGQQEAMPLGG